MNKSFFAYSKKNVNKELRSSLTQSIEFNNNALDYIKNKKNLVSSMHKFNEEDTSIQDELNTLEYIELALKHVGKMYNDNLKKV